MLVTLYCLETPTNLVPNTLMSVIQKCAVRVDHKYDTERKGEFAREKVCDTYVNHNTDEAVAN